MPTPPYLTLCLSLHLSRHHDQAGASTVVVVIAACHPMTLLPWSAFLLAALAY
jgi:hypothetical protein